MKIAFISKDQNLSRASYRIHIDNLNYYFNSINIISKINPHDIENYNFLIFDKPIENIYKKNKDQKIGIITPNCKNIKSIRKCDFIIVGSVEEKDSIIKYNKNCFIFPQIEKLYLNVIPKIHIKKDIIIIGYHGNDYHLNHINLGLNKALERLSKEFNIKFVYICQNKTKWEIGKPNIKIEFKKWNIKNILNDIMEFDIAIVPNISEINQNNKLNVNNNLGLYNTDYKIRFKNKSNIGRALVLFQLGIPVVADMTPSNIHILGNPDNGYAVLSEEGWYIALKELCCEKQRNFISKNAYKECKRLYDPLKWAEKLINKIKLLP